MTCGPKAGGLGAVSGSRVDRLTLALVTPDPSGRQTASQGALCPGSLSDNEDRLVPTCCGHQAQL